MHIHLPKPLHGWREFVGEVGIIVLGVLIALGAEQAIESLRWRHETHDFRAAVDHEIALDLGVSRFHALQQRCIDRRLDELEAWLELSRSGRTVPLLNRISGPAELSLYSSVWNNKDDQVVEHLPQDVRLKYAELYDEFRNTDAVMSEERDIWASLVPFDEPGALSLADRRNLHALISRARGLEKLMKLNAPVAENAAATLGIRPLIQAEAQGLAADLPNSPLCKPLLAPI